MSEEEDSKKVIDGNTPRKGWEVVRDYMDRHDKKMIDDFNDDINTLLVFAGLFSAVVTAFVIEFYKMLQEDFTQTSAQLLSQISVQLASFSINGSYVNSTVQEAPTARSPTPSTATVWVNTLWFLSLMLSLAAALFGMVTKQWLREYDQWTNFSSSLQDIIHLRQMRYDALIRWKVPTIIAAMPAMLEFALILFLVGMIVLLWTVNGAIAGILTAVVAVLVILSAATTFLPVFFPRCPYKSPVCWAFMRLGWLCSYKMSLAVSKAYDATSYRFRKLRPFLDNLSYTLVPPGHDTWRVRDHSNHPLNNITIIGAPGFHYPGLDREAAQLVSLIRGLGWIHDTSQDTRLLESVSACWQTSTFRNDSHVLIFAAFHIACYMLHMELGAMSEGLDAVCCVETENNHTIRSIYLNTDGLSWIRTTGIWANAIQGQNAQLTGFLAHAFKRFMDDFHFFLRIADLSAEDQLTVIRMALRVLTLSLLLPKQYSTVTPDHQAFNHKIIAIFHQLTIDEEMCGRLPGVRRLIIDDLERRRSHHWPSLLTSKIGSRVPKDASRLTIRMILAIHMYDSEGTPNFKRRESCDLFVHVAHAALQGLRIERVVTTIEEFRVYWSKSDEEAMRTARTLFRHMTACVQDSLAQKWPNCGSYTQVPWLKELYSLFIRHSCDVLEDLFPHALVHALALCREKGLIKDDLGLLDDLIERSEGLSGTANASTSGPAGRPRSPSHDGIRDAEIILTPEVQVGTVVPYGGVSRSGSLAVLSGRQAAKDASSPSAVQPRPESPSDADTEGSDAIPLLSLRTPEAHIASSSREDPLVHLPAPSPSSSSQTDQTQAVEQAALIAHPAARAGTPSLHVPSYQTASAGLQVHETEEHPPAEAPAVSLDSPSLQTEGPEAETTAAFPEPSEQSLAGQGPSSSSDNFTTAPAEPEPEDTPSRQGLSVEALDPPLGAPTQRVGSSRLEMDRAGEYWPVAEASDAPSHASRTYEPAARSV